MADVSIQEIIDEYELQIGKLTGETIRLRAALKAYEREELERAPKSE